MKSFEVKVNGNIVCTAGIQSEKGVLTTHIISVTGLDNQPDGISLNISGLNSAINESLKWVAKEVRIGDEILVRIIDSEEIDQPTSTSQPLDPEAILRSKLKTYYQLNEELAEYIKE